MEKHINDTMITTNESQQKERNKDEKYTSVLTMIILR